MEDVELPETERYLLSKHLRLLEYLEREIKESSDLIKEELRENEDIRLLKTIPGIGDVFAPLIALEIYDIKRFFDYRRLWSYSGLVPSTYASGKRVYHGRLIKYCNKWLRWALVEAAHTSIRSSLYFGRYYEMKKSQKGTATAIIATARRLARIVYWVLKTGREYEELWYSWDTY